MGVRIVADQGLLPQVLGPDVIVLDQRRVRGKDGDDFGAADDLGVDARLFQSDHRYAEVDVADDDVLADLLRGQSGQAHADAGVALAKPLGRRGQKPKGGGGAGGDAQQPELLVPDPLGEDLQRFDLAEYPVGVGDQDVRFRGRHQSPAEPLEQPIADLAFEVSQNLADRRLRDVQRLCRGGQGPVTHDGAEDFKLACVHLTAAKPNYNQGLCNTVDNVLVADLPAGKHRPSAN